MPDENAKNKYVWAEIDETLHRTLCRWATKYGKHPSDMIARYIKAGITQDAKEAKDPPPWLLVFKALEKGRDKDSTISMLRQLAYRCQRGDGDDEALYDSLKVLCALNGVSVERMMSEASQSPSPPVIITDDGTGVSSAMAWLQVEIQKGEEYPSTMVEKSGALQGFSKGVLKEAKRELGIISKRRAHNWVWVWPDTLE